jgi:hypothetical protein
MAVQAEDCDVAPLREAGLALPIRLHRKLSTAWLDLASAIL